MNELVPRESVSQLFPALTRNGINGKVWKKRER